MKKYTFMLTDYVDCEPSDWDYLYDENRDWELKHYVIANSKEEALKKLFRDFKRNIIDEETVEITEVFINYEIASDCIDEITRSWQIVSINDARDGIDYVPENITLVDFKSFKEKWGDGEKRTKVYFFSDNTKITEVSKAAPGWYESETRVSNKEASVIIHSHGEDIYNKGDKIIYAIQRVRFSLINDYEKEKSLRDRKIKESVKKATQASRETFLDREMPYLVA